VDARHAAEFAGLDEAETAQLLEDLVDAHLLENADAEARCYRLAFGSLMRATR
jgi:hypothetical protein